MSGTLGFDALKAAVASGEIDTVLVCFTDMQGRLIGKRFHAPFFIDGGHAETHACDYLLANDIDMEPVPGYAAASWQKGYGDFVMKLSIYLPFKSTQPGALLMHPNDLKDRKSVV